MLKINKNFLVIFDKYGKICIKGSRGLQRV